MRKLILLFALICLHSIIHVEEGSAGYVDEVIADGPVAYYRFEETSGIVANDSSGNGNNGTYVNGVLLNQAGFSSQLGRAASFDGVNDYVDTPQTVANNFTLEAWINTTATSLTGSQGYEGNGIIWSDVPGSANDFIMAILNNQLAFMTGNPDITVSGGPLVNDGRWHHIVGTRQQGGTISIYVDGVFIGSASTNNNPLNANANIRIGGNTLDSRYFNGLIDEVAYYPTVLTPERILVHYRAGLETRTVPTMSEWGMVLFMIFAAGGSIYFIRRQRIGV